MLPGSRKHVVPYFKELRDAQQRRVVLVLLGHGLLQGEHVAEVHHGVEVVGEDAAHGVRIADVHVVVAEARRHHHVAAVDDAVGRHVAQPMGLVDAGNARPCSIQDGPVLDDPALGVESEDKAGAVDLEGRHAADGMPAAAGRQERARRMDASRREGWSSERRQRGSLTVAAARRGGWPPPSSSP